MKNYAHTLRLKLPPSIVFEAITKEMSSWWTQMSSTVGKVGDQTTAKFEDGTTWSFEVVTLEKDKLIEFRCFEANHIHPVTSPAMRTEWENTVLRFELIPTQTGTALYFTHLGLTPELNCYEICRSGWGHFFGTAFQTYLNNKVGKT